MLELVAPASVVDFGCGLGTWLTTFTRHGVADYLGIDGGWVSPEMLEIPRERFVAARLDRPLELGRGSTSRFRSRLPSTCRNRLPGRSSDRSLSMLPASSSLPQFLIKADSIT